MPEQVTGAVPRRREGAARPRRSSTPAATASPVHLLDIHLEKGMHCVDCHFVQDVHGNNRLQQEVRAAIEIQCIDCHGTADEARHAADHAARRRYTSGPTARAATWRRCARPSGKRAVRDRQRRTSSIQNSMVEKDLRWEVVQTADTINPAQRALQREVAPGQDGPVRRGRQDGLGRPARRRREAPAPTRTRT